MTGQGPSGQIVLSYLTAAVFGPWSFDGGPQGGTLRASVVSVDPYRITQTPLSVSIHLGTTTWRRPVVDLTITGSSLVATLGPAASAQT